MENKFCINWFCHLYMRALLIVTSNKKEIAMGIFVLTIIFTCELMAKPENYVTFCANFKNTIFYIKSFMKLNRLLHKMPNKLLSPEDAAGYVLADIASSPLKKYAIFLGIL